MRKKSEGGRKEALKILLDSSVVVSSVVDPNDLRVGWFVLVAGDVGVVARCSQFFHILFWKPAEFPRPSSLKDVFDAQHMVFDMDSQRSVHTSGTWRDGWQQGQPKL